MIRKVCIIDDDLVSQFATRYCIEQYSEEFTISIYANAEEALVFLSDLLVNNEAFPDIIFLDLVMGEMNGWEFLDNLQNLVKGQKFPQVYVLSSFVNSKDREIAKENLLIEGYLDKPLSSNSLEQIFAAKTSSESSTL